MLRYFYLISSICFTTAKIFKLIAFLFRLQVLKNNTKHEALEPIRPRATTPERFRISRSSTRKYLQFHDKTLSKVKLL